MIYIGSDHRGYNLKEALKIYLKELNYDFEDLGAKELNSDDDYPDFALTAAKKVAENPNENRGILICGSGVGVDIVANKIRNIRSALCFDVKQAQMSRNDDNTNVLSLSADFISKCLAKEIVKIWLETPFSGLERHTRRIEKIKELDESHR
ncbi:MAG: RpiB/LacA/LacB family sugar-phosphate isomerase [Candidatus Azambacteria bacterium]|nr:RpiB/LacA/LacB family sugar-phosphate isomerase [Candidatus Azambacteria bacterium]